MNQTVKNVQQQIDQFIPKFYEFSKIVSRVHLLLSWNTLKNIGKLVKIKSFRVVACAYGIPWDLRSLKELEEPKRLFSDCSV